MAPVTIFAIQYVFSFVVFSLILVWFVLPKLGQKNIAEAITPLLFLHALRTIGLTYLVPAVADPGIPALFTRPTAYGDLISATLALIAILALRYFPKTPATPAALIFVWLFNIVGLADLAIAMILAFQVQLLNYRLESMWFIPAFVVPALIVTHIAIFWMLWKHHRGEWPATRRPVSP
jgi:hypothetical protein